MKLRLLVLMLFLLLGMSFAQTSTPIQTASLTLSAAQIQHLMASPLEIVSAPGVGKALNVMTATMQYKSGSSAYTIPSGGNVSLSVGPSSGTTVVVFVPALGFIDRTVDQFYMSPANGIGPASVQSFANQDLEVSNTGGAEWTGGDGTLTITVTYTIVSLQ
jgi:hypothetical protein